MKTLVTIIALTVTGFTAVYAETPVVGCEEESPVSWVGISSTTFGGECQFILTSDDFIANFGVYLQTSIPLKKIRFKLPVPTWDGVILESPNYVFPTIVDPQNGIEVDLGGCVDPQGGSILLMTFSVFTQDLLSAGTVPCTSWRVEGFPSSGEIEVVDCDDNLRKGTSIFYDVRSIDQGPCGCGILHQCPALPPTVFPADGTTNVPTNVTLSWAPNWGVANVFVGTTPDCTNGTSYTILFPGTTLSLELAEGVTYYWTVQTGQSAPPYCYNASGVKSFTTGTSIATQESTWGNIKSLFRE